MSAERENPSGGGDSLGERAERWLFAPGSARRLAAVRIGLCSVLALRLSRGIYVSLTGQPRALFRPLSFMRLLPSMPPRGLVLAVQAVGVLSALLAAVGLRARISLPLAWVIALFLNGMVTSVGKIIHNDVLLLLALVPLLPAATSDAWSRDASRAGRARVDRTSSRYGWPLRTAMVVVAGGYFFTGLAKMIFSGPAWALSDNLRWVMYASRGVPNGAALFIADRPWLAHTVAAVTLLIELGFPIVLWRPRAAWLFVPGVIALHAGIWATMGLNYFPWAATVVVIFVDWPAVVEHARGVAAAMSERKLGRARRLVAADGTPPST